MNDNLLHNEFLEETLQEIFDIKEEVASIKEKYEPGSIRRRKAVEAEFQIEQILELFAAAKQLDTYIDEHTTGRQLIEERFESTIEQLRKEESKPSIVKQTKVVTKGAAEKSLDATFSALGAFGDWLGSVTSSRRTR